MAVYTQVSAEALGTFLRGFDCGELVSAKGIAEGVENTNYLVDTTTARFILTLYEKRVDAGDLPFFLDLLDHLADRGLPVPPAIRDRDGVAIQTLEGRPACLIRFLNGVSVTRPTPDQAATAGASLGALHAAVADFDGGRPNSLGIADWRPLLMRCGSDLDPIAPGLFARVDTALAAVEAAWQATRRATAMADGATLIAPDTVWFAHDTLLGRDVTIEPNVVFGPGVRVADGAVIHAFSHVEGAVIGEKADVGPFARLRPGADLGAGSRVGNFVEVKKATIGVGAKVNHLSYIGDAEIGARANIGAGTITCNYDGYFKYRTVVGEDAFIGSNSALVAPVTVGRGAIVAAGSVLTRDVDADALALVRPPQVDKPGWAARFREMMVARKAARR